MIPIKKINKNNICDHLTDDGSLYILVASSHAGYVNGNRVAYLPQRTDGFAKTTTKPYQKPQLVGHNRDDIPVGRVIDGLDINLVPKDGIDPMVINKKLSKTVNEVKALAERLYKIGEDKASNYKYATGLLVTVVKISDDETISNISKGLINSVSIGAYPDGMYCSICNQNWAKDGMCMHWPGEEDSDGKTMFFVAGPLEMNEQSFVNVPADPGAKIVAVLTEDEVNSKSYKENAMTMLDEKNTDTKATPSDNVLEDSKTKESEGTISELKIEIEALKDSIKVKDESIVEKDLTIDSLNTETERLNSLIDELSTEVKEVLLLKIADALQSLGRKHDKELIDARFGDKTVIQLKDYLDIMNIEDEEKEVPPDGEKDPIVDSKLEEVETNENLEDFEKIVVPNRIRDLAARKAAKGGAAAGEKIIKDYLSSQQKVEKKEEKTGDK